jgi:hypothetical protein
MWRGKLAASTIGAVFARRAGGAAPLLGAEINRTTASVQQKIWACLAQGGGIWDVDEGNRTITNVEATEGGHEGRPY